MKMKMKTRAMTMKPARQMKPGLTGHPGRGVSDMASRYRHGQSARGRMGSRHSYLGSGARREVRDTRTAAAKGSVPTGFGMRASIAAAVVRDEAAQDLFPRRGRHAEGDACRAVVDDEGPIALVGRLGQFLDGGGQEAEECDHRARE